MINDNKIDASGEYEIKIVRAESLVGGRTADECLTAGEFESFVKKNRVFRTWYNYLGLLGGGNDSRENMKYYANTDGNCPLQISLIGGTIDEQQEYETSQLGYGGFASQVLNTWKTNWNTKEGTSNGFILKLNTSKVVTSQLTVSGLMISSTQGTQDLIKDCGWSMDNGAYYYYYWNVHYHPPAISLVRLSNSISLNTGDTIYISYKLSSFFVGSNWRKTKTHVWMSQSQMDNYRYLYISEKLAPKDPTRVLGMPSMIGAPIGGMGVSNSDWCLSAGFSGSHTRNSNTEEVEFGSAYITMRGSWEDKIPYNSRMVCGWNDVSKVGSSYRSQVIRRKTGISLIVDGNNPPTSLATVTISGGSPIPRNVFYNCTPVKTGSSATSKSVILGFTQGSEIITVDWDLSTVGNTDLAVVVGTSGEIPSGTLYVKLLDSTTIKLAATQANTASGPYITPSGTSSLQVDLDLAVVAVVSRVKDSGLESSLPFIWSDMDQGSTASYAMGSGVNDSDANNNGFMRPMGQAVIWSCYDQTSNRIFHGTRTHGKSGIFEPDRNDFRSAIVSWNYNTIENGFEEELTVGTSCGDCYNGNLVVGYFGNKIRHYDVSSGYTFTREVSTSGPVHAIRFDTTTGIAWIHILGVGIAKYITGTGVLTEYTLANTFTALTAANFNYHTKSLDVYNGILTLGYNSKIPTRVDWHSTPPAAITGVNLGQLVLDTTNFNYGLVNAASVGNYGTPRWVIPSRGTDRNVLVVSFIERNGMYNTPQSDPTTINLFTIVSLGSGTTPTLTRDTQEFLTLGAQDIGNLLVSPVVMGIHHDNNGLSARVIIKGSNDEIGRTVAGITTHVKPKGYAESVYSSVPEGAHNGGIEYYYGESVSYALSTFLSEGRIYYGYVNAPSIGIGNTPITDCLNSIARLNGCIFNQHNTMYINGMLHVLKGIMLMPIPKVEYLGPAVNVSLPSSGVNLTFQNAGGFPSSSQLVAGECYNFGAGPAIMKTGLTTVTFPYVFPSRPTRTITITGTSPSAAPGWVQPAETLTRWFHDVQLAMPLTITVNGNPRTLATAAPQAGQVWIDVMGKVTFHPDDFNLPFSITCTCQEQFN